MLHFINGFVPLQFLQLKKSARLVCYRPARAAHDFLSSNRVALAPIYVSTQRQMSFWIASDPCYLSNTARFDIFVDTFFLVKLAPVRGEKVWPDLTQIHSQTLFRYSCTFASWRSGSPSSSATTRREECTLTTSRAWVGCLKHAKAFGSKSPLISMRKAP